MPVECTQGTRERWVDDLIHVRHEIIDGILRARLSFWAVRWALSN
jgi:hypothetical protein